MAEIKKGARIVGATRDKLATDLKKRRAPVKPMNSPARERR